MIEVTEDFRRYRWSVTTNTVRASRTFWVSGTTSREAALAAVDAVTGLAVPQANHAIEPGSPMTCEGPVVEDLLSFDLWVIRCDFSVAVDGVQGGTLNPLLMPAEVEWTPKETIVPVETDMDGRPIVNANRDRFSAPSRRVTYWGLRIYRNEPMFNLPRAEAYSNKVNSVGVSLGGIVAVGVAKMRCNIIAPVGRYKVRGNLYVPHVYDFDVFLNEGLGRLPFDHAFLNAGRNGYYVAGSKKILGPFVSDADLPLAIAQDVRLNRFGLPISLYATINQDIKVGDGTSNGKHAPAAVPGEVDFYDYEAITAGGVDIGYRAYFKGCARADLNDLGNLLL